jgi:hypothetical protein
VSRTVSKFRPLRYVQNKAAGSEYVRRAYIAAARGDGAAVHAIAAEVRRKRAEG